MNRAFIVIHRRRGAGGSAHDGLDFLLCGIYRCRLPVIGGRGVRCFRTRGHHGPNTESETTMMDGPLQQIAKEQAETFGTLGHHITTGQ